MTEVLIITGSKSDSEIADTVKETLDSFGVDSVLEVSSAHRTPEKTAELAKNAESRGFKVVITVAGYAAHLGGVVASWTILPVISVPVSSSPLRGIDSILSIVQMPGGVPVAAMSLDKAGAKNAAIFAVEILALGNNVLKEKIKKLRENFYAVDRM
ncbi:5-(carboxyamino)imidazole ribonucleotide mutase [candidate division WOR-3 bacterium]|nr:5-(carboxyamino)imidazole ribonucleotide mutase [candidate division WOR-3 bacterium]